MFKFKNWSKRKKIIVGIIVIIIIGIGSNQTETTSTNNTNLSSDLSKDDLFVEFQVNKSDSIFNNDHLNYLIRTFGDPLDVKTPKDSEKFGYININSFWAPFFNKDESLKILEEFKFNEKQYRLKLFKWLSKTGPVSSENRNWDSYKSKMEKFYDKYKNLYEKKSDGRKIHIIEIFESYSKKNPEKSLEENLKEFQYLFGRYDNNTKAYGSWKIKSFITTVYKFKTQEKSSLLKYYEQGDKRKDFEIDLFRTLTISADGKVAKTDSETNSSFCISDQSRSEIKKLLTEGTGDWSLGQKGNVQGSYKFFDNGQYRMANMYSPKVNGLPQPTIGNWWINCSGEIVCSKQRDNMIITESGILNGQSLYSKYQ